MRVFFFLPQNSNGIYTGFIKVQMELCKPSQAAGKPTPSSNGCMNTLHISSTNTVGEVIEALLKKFLVTESLILLIGAYKMVLCKTNLYWDCNLSCVKKASM